MSRMSSKFHPWSARIHGLTSKKNEDRMLEHTFGLFDTFNWATEAISFPTRATSHWLTQEEAVRFEGKILFHFACLQRMLTEAAGLPSTDETTKRIEKAMGRVAMQLAKASDNRLQ